MLKRYIVLDCETGGIGKGKSLLTAYFAIMDEDFVVLDELYLHLKSPDDVYHVTAEALRINGIDLKQHDEIAIPYKAGGTKLYEFIAKHSVHGQNKLIPLGHNVNGDIEWICEHLMSENSWKHNCSYRVRDSGIVGNTLIDAGRIPSTVSGSLGSFAEHFGIKVDNLHDAKVDALTSAYVYKAMLRML